MKFDIAVGTDIGRRRQQNQDNLGAFADLGLFLIADGMGGHKGGETASSMVVDIVPQFVRESRDQYPNNPEQSLLHGIQEANRAIFHRSNESMQLRGMGTTITAVMFSKDDVWIAHVGDSRCYFYRNGHFWQVTRDHSLVHEKFRAGLITRESMKTDKWKNVITRSVGFEKSVEIDLYHMTAKPGDLYLLCSDGLTNSLDDEQIRSTVIRRQNRDEFSKLTTELIAEANDTGGDDNITVLVARRSE